MLRFLATVCTSNTLPIYGYVSLLTTAGRTFYNVASISFSRVAFVLSHYDGFFEFAMNFLLCYAWPWKCHSISINSQSENPLATNPQQLGDIFTFQIHVRYIVLDTKDRKIPIKRRPGVQLMRQSGWLLDNDKSRNAYFMREARASIAVKIPLARPVPSCFSIISFAEGIEAVADDIPFEYSKVGQLTGMHVVLWKLDHILGQSLRLWNKVLDALDTKLRVTVRDFCSIDSCLPKADIQSRSRHSATVTRCEILCLIRMTFGGQSNISTLCSCSASSLTGSNKPLTTLTHRTRTALTVCRRSWTLAPTTPSGKKTSPCLIPRGKS